MSNTTTTYEKFEIDVTLSNYGLFDGIDHEVNGERLNADATKTLFASAAQKTLERWYPGADVSVSFHPKSEELAADKISVEGGTDDENYALEQEIEQGELIDFSDAENWAYEPIAESASN